MMISEIKTFARESQQAAENGLMTAISDYRHTQPYSQALSITKETMSSIMGESLIVSFSDSKDIQN